MSAGLLTVLLALAGLLLGAGPASAHATLVGTDPADGQVLTSAPDEATFTFDEPVRLQSGGVHLFAADGEELRADASTSDRTLVVGLPSPLADGTYIVAWRVLSTDGHPVAGALTFSIGEPSARVATPDLDQRSTTSGVEVGLAAVQALVYIGLFVVVGLRFFLVVLLPREAVLDDVRDRLTRALTVGSWVAVGAAVVQLPVTVAYQRGSDLASALGPAFLEIDTSAPDQLAAVLLIGGVLACVLLPSRFALGGAAIALASLALVGHTRSYGPRPLTVLADVSHVVAGSIWLGGLVGLAVALPRLSARPRLAATALARFSGVAAVLLAVVAGTGTLLAWRILGSWSGFVDTSFGVTLLIKIGLVGVVALLAGWNRYRLLPAVIADEGHQQRADAGRRLQRAIRVEATLLVVVLGVTGVLVDRSPSVSAASGGIAAPAGLDANTFVGRAPGLRVVMRLDPLGVGANEVLVQLQDETENPLEPFAAPSVAFRAGDLDLGDQQSTNVDSGTYRVEVVFPRGGRWTAEVTIRTSEFDSRVVPVEFTLR